MHNGVYLTSFLIRSTKRTPTFMKEFANRNVISYNENRIFYSCLRCNVQDVRSALPIGTIIGDRYNVVGLLGKGGFGAVYLVRDQRVRGNLFALKEMIDTSRQERARFSFESELLTRLDHPALPRVYRSFENETNNRSYMLMDFIEGPNLETLRQ